MQQIDPALLAKAKAGDEAATAAVIARMMPLIRKGAAACKTPGLDFEDAVQEGLIGLFQALRHYDQAAYRDIPFAGYAASCIANAQRDAYRTASRKKHAPLNNSVPLPGDADLPLAAVHSAADPESITIAGEQYAELLLRMQSDLSDRERRALLCSLAGCSAAETARRLGCAQKAAENALARARRKLKTIL